MTEHLLNAVFDQLKVETRDSRGFVTEHVTVPALLQVLEKHNGRDIVKMLDAAELLEANIRSKSFAYTLQYSSGLSLFTSAPYRGLVRSLRDV